MLFHFAANLLFHFATNLLFDFAAHLLFDVLANLSFTAGLFFHLLAHLLFDLAIGGFFGVLYDLFEDVERQKNACGEAADPDQQGCGQPVCNAAHRHARNQELRDEKAEEDNHEGNATHELWQLFERHLRHHGPAHGLDD